MIGHLTAGLTAGTAPNRLICAARRDLRQRSHMPKHR